MRSGLAGARQRDVGARAVISTGPGGADRGRVGCLPACERTDMPGTPGFAESGIPDMRLPWKIS